MHWEKAQSDFTPLKENLHAPAAALQGIEASLARDLGGMRSRAARQSEVSAAQRARLDDMRTRLAAESRESAEDLDRRHAELEAQLEDARAALDDVRDEERDALAERAVLLRTLHHLEREANVDEELAQVHLRLRVYRDMGLQGRVERHATDAAPRRASLYVHSDKYHFSESMYSDVNRLWRQLAAGGHKR